MEVETLKNKLLIVIIALLILFSPIDVFADEDLIISSWLVEAELKEDGSLAIIKDVTYDFNSSFNGIYMDIILDDMMEVKDLQVFELESGQEIEYSQDQRAKKGQSQVYSMDLTANSANIMVFSPSEDEIKTFRFKYLLTNVASRHTDTGELYFKLIGANNETPIDYFKATIELPSFSQNDVKIFAHGPLHGKTYYDKEVVVLEVNDLPAKTFVETRILFPQDYIPLASRQGNRSLEEILDEEESLLEKIREDAVRRENRKSILNKISLGLSALGLLILGFLVTRLKRNPDIFTNMKDIYPDEISPAELSLFMNLSIGPRAYIATLLDLARREYLRLETITSTDIKKKTKVRESDTYLFIKNDTPTNKLLKHEEFLMSWFFNTIGDGKKLTTAEIDGYREKYSTNFYKEQSAWSKLVKDELLSREYYDPRGKTYGVFTLVISLFLFVLSIVSLVNEGLFGILLLLISFIMMIYGITLFQRKSERGYIQYQLWKDFKKNNQVKGSEGLGLSTDLAIIYLIALGLPMKDLDEYRKSVDFEYYPMHWGYFFFLTNSQGGSRFEDSFNKSFYGNATNSSSSSFGGGGGFSAGGGGGVGGSGSGGF